MFGTTAGAAKAISGGILVCLAILVSIGSFSGSAHAQSNCEPRDSLLGKLDRLFDERPVAIGLASTGNLLEVLTSAAGTWTILITTPDGVTCIAAAGDHWQSLNDLKPAGETS